MLPCRGVCHPYVCIILVLSAFRYRTNSPMEVDGFDAVLLIGFAFRSVLPFFFRSPAQAPSYAHSTLLRSRGSRGETTTQKIQRSQTGRNETMSESGRESTFSRSPFHSGCGSNECFLFLLFVQNIRSAEMSLTLALGELQHSQSVMLRDQHKYTSIEREVVLLTRVIMKQYLFPSFNDNCGWLTHAFVKP